MSHTVQQQYVDQVFLHFLILQSSVMLSLIQDKGADSNGSAPPINLSVSKYHALSYWPSPSPYAFWRAFLWFGTFIQCSVYIWVPPTWQHISYSPKGDVGKNLKCHTQPSSNMPTGSFYTSSYFSDVTSSWPPPSPVSKLSDEPCARERDARHSKTLADFPELYNMRCPSNLDLFGCWHRRRDSDGCQMSWNVPAEYTHRHHRHRRPCPHLVYLGTYWIWWVKNNQLRMRVKCQTAHLCLNE